jgi:hypothetical protein
MVYPVLQRVFHYTHLGVTRLSSMWVVDAVLNRCLDEVQRLLAGEADVAYVDLDGHCLYGHLGVVKWLLRSVDNDGRTALHQAVASGHMTIVTWLMHFVEVWRCYRKIAILNGCTDFDDDQGRLLWTVLGNQINDAKTAMHIYHLRHVLKVMLARGMPPSFFINPSYLPYDLRPLLAQGAVILQRLPPDSLWRAQRTAALQASDCGQRLVAAVCSVVGGYAEMSEEELWEVLEQEQAQESTSTSGVKRKRC